MVVDYSFSNMISQKYKVNFMKGLSYFMNLPTHVTRVFDQFHEPSKLVHDSSKPTWHVANLNFRIVDLYF